jgi:hypothetical protein
MVIVQGCLKLRRMRASILVRPRARMLAVRSHTEDWMKSVQLIKASASRDNFGVCRLREPEEMEASRKRSISLRR